jgi:hypothetical protein
MVDFIAAAFSNDDELIALASGHQLQIIHRETGNELTSSKNSADSELYTSLSFNADGTRLAVGLFGFAGGGVQLFDLIAGAQFDFVKRAGDVTAVLFLNDGRLFVGSSDGTVSLYDKYKADVLAQIVSLPDNGGLVVEPRTGAFDGFADAISYVGWRLPKGPLGGVYPLDLLFDDYYVPGLFAEVLRGVKHDHIAPFAVSVEARIPGLKVALAQRLVSIRNVDGGPAVCFREKPNVALDGSLGVLFKGKETAIDNSSYENRDDADCPFAIQLSGKFEEYKLVSAPLNSSFTGNLSPPATT